MKSTNDDDGRTPASLCMAEAALAGRSPEQARWHYRDGFLLSALTRVAEAFDHEPSRVYVRSAMERIVEPDGTITSYERDDFDLDAICPGNSLFGLYARTGEERYRTALDTLRGQLRMQPRTRSGGFWRRRASPDQMWLNGVYMAVPFYARYAAAAGELGDFADVAHQLLLMEEKARDPLTGLPCHAWDESRRQLWANPETGRSSCCWSRALGWYVMALVDVLELFPGLHTGRAGLVGTLERLAAAVLRHQDPASGMWRQVVGLGDREGNYLESSGSCMIAYALLKAARLGVLPHGEADPAARRALDGVRGRFIGTDADGRLTLSGISASAILGGAPLRDGSAAYYCGLGTLTNDPRGVGAFILASIEEEAALRSTGAAGTAAHPGLPPRT
jgi:unsaturated rhamnogalacturonyl hydrolase